MDDAPFELTDREMLEDLAISQNHIVSLYNGCLCETESVQLRESLLKILSDEHNNLQQIHLALKNKGMERNKTCFIHSYCQLKKTYINLQNAIQ